VATDFLPSLQLFIEQFREPEPAGRFLLRTTGASSGPCPATLCPATGLPERSIKLAVVHGSENQLFGGLQNVGWASYPKRTTVEHRRVDPGGGGPGYPIPCRASGSAGGTATARPTPGWRLVPFWPGRRASAPAPSLRPDRAGWVC
jgi:hypothetical protein